MRPFRAARSFHFADATFRAMRCFVFVAAAFWGRTSFLFVIGLSRAARQLCIVGMAFWGRAMFCCLSGIWGHASIFNCRSLFGPRNDPVCGHGLSRPHDVWSGCCILWGRTLFCLLSQPDAAVRQFRFVDAAFWGRAMFCCHPCGLSGPFVAFVCHCNLFELCDNSALWARPFGAAHYFVFDFTAAAFSGLHVNFYSHGLFGPGNQLQLFRTARSFRFACVAFGAVQCFDLLQRPFGAMHCL